MIKRTILASLVLCSTITILLTGIIQAEDVELPDNYGVCADFKSRLAPGIVAEVNEGYNLNLRANPSIKINRINQIDPGGQIIVLGGPVCVDEIFTFWQVAYDDQFGWISEGEIADRSEYYVEPVAMIFQPEEGEAVPQIPDQFLQVSELPATGEAPWWRLPAMGVLVITIFFAVIGSFMAFRATRHTAKLSQ